MESVKLIPIAVLGGISLLFLVLLLDNNLLKKWIKFRNQSMGIKTEITKKTLRYTKLSAVIGLIISIILACSFMLTLT